MKFDASHHHRQSIRLKGHDYATDGIYFVTLCTYQRLCLFGSIENGVMHRNEYGQIVATEWLRSVHIRQEIEMGDWVVMPNHIHGIVIINRITDPDGPEIMDVGCNGFGRGARPCAPTKPVATNRFIWFCPNPSRGGQ